MRRLVWLLVPLVLSGCGGGKSGPTLTVTCSAGTALAGATSIEVLGDPVNGRPTMRFPDPANSGRTETIAVPAKESCKIVATPPG